MQSEQFQLHAEIEERHWWFVARRQIVRRLIATVLPSGRRHTIIDVGCGTGANVASLADGYRCLGIDTSAEAIELAERRFPQVQFTCGFAPQALGEEFARADLVMLNDVLEHVPDDFELLSSLLAAARPGTHFLITVPADMALWSPHDVSFGHYRRYDLERFRETWAGLPVSTLLASPFNSRLYPLVRFIRERNRRRGEANGTAGTDFKVPAKPINLALRRIFAGEAGQLTKLATGQSNKLLSKGVSLIALLRRDEGCVATRQKSNLVAGDRFNPSKHAILLGN
jgi:SAM-dependent methyltransferase